MREGSKEEIRKVLSLLEKVHCGIKKYIYEYNFQLVQALLEDCQSAAISIGEEIEELEGDDCNVVRLLEKYCEFIFQLYEALTSIISVQQEGIDGQTLITSEKLSDRIHVLDDILGQITSSINEIEVRKETVFLPYKASMWDSLESIWKAANDDPACDAYVIPIPYFDRNADGSFGEMHYEGEMYPEYVQITDYKKFDFGKHTPDMIFIHNPYDGWNKVTSVHPDFYSEKLKEYTNMLVYVPYFVWDMQEAMKPEHEIFYLLPGVIHAQRVIAQSEDEKQLYVNALLKRFGNSEQNVEMLQEKIVGVGSPKFDSVRLHKKESCIIPDEWKSIIENKKVILYNTHLSLLMKENSESFLIKIKDVFELFRKRKDVVLLWRPHPLMIRTAESMNPAVIEEYMKIVNVFRNEKWGIYDDTPDLARAIAISDAYYGSEESSLATLFQVAGKPVLIQNIDVIGKNFVDYIHKKNLREEFNAGYVLETTAWNEALPKFLDMVCEMTENSLDGEVVNVGSEIYSQISKAINNA